MQEKTSSTLPPWQPTQDIKLSRYFYYQSTLTLDSGRKIYLTNLHQSRTYANVIEGIPRYSPEDASQRFAILSQQHDPLYLLDQTPVPLPISASYAKDLSLLPNLYSLPPITIVARFESSSPAQKPGETPDSLECSALNFLWFQQNFAMPIDDQICSKLKAIDWDHHAKNLGVW